MAVAVQGRSWRMVPGYGFFFFFVKGSDNRLWE
jgi:hypothetical protein